MKRTAALAGALFVLLLVGIPTASAAVLEIPIDTVVRASAGSTTLLASHNTPADLVGETCLITARAENQSSTHPGNDLIISSGGDAITVSDVERSAGAVTEASDYLQLGTTITVSLHMGRDQVFSGGLVLEGECPPPPTTTTTTTTTTTQPPTTTTTSAGPSTSVPTNEPPVIIIEKTPASEYYGQDGVGRFVIKVTNPGPVDLTAVRVTDEIAIAMDPDSDCEYPEVPDLAVGESFTYECTVANLNGVSPFTNEATAIGKGPDGTEATDTDDATVFPPVLATTLTQPPSTVPGSTVPSTLPVTGVAFEQMRGFSIAGLTFVFAGIVLLAAAAVISHRRMAQTPSYLVLRLEIEPIPRRRTLHIKLHKKH